MLKRWVLHPFLWSIYPVLMLVAYNIQQMSPAIALRSLVVFPLLAGLLLVLFHLVLRSWQKAALLVTLGMILFFTYGHLYGVLRNFELFGVNLGRQMVLIAVWVILFLAGLAWVIRTRRDLSTLTQALNVIVILALVFPLFQVLSFDAKHPGGNLGSNTPAGQNVSSLPAEFAGLQLPPGQTPPDIYYFILDAYSRDDTLSKYFNLDNSAFLEQLSDSGFYVARCSQSNYSKTQLSLSSSLNMGYLDQYGIQEENAEDQPALNRLIWQNQVRRALEQLGYQIVVVESGFSPTEWTDADLFLSGDQQSTQASLTGGVNPFEALLMRTSAGLLLYRVYPHLPYSVRSFIDTAYTERRNRILYAFDELPEVPRVQGPKFVFAHILAPHEPFVFGPKGEIVGRQYPFTLNDDLEYRDPVRYILGYRNQVKFINSQVIPLVQAILDRSAQPPIIILQGDHGALGRITTENARMTILNAYYLPQGKAQNLYPTISPVNTFRFIFNNYFGVHLPMLEDISFYYNNKTDQMILSPNERRDCQ